MAKELNEDEASQEVVRNICWEAKIPSDVTEVAEQTLVGTGRLLKAISMPGHKLTRGYFDPMQNVDQPVDVICAAQVELIDRQWRRS
jgi:hypothetical protein